MPNIKTKKILTIYKIFLLFFLLSANKAFSASLNLSPANGNFSVGDNISVRLRVSTSGESINAISSVLNYSNNTLSLSSITKSGSIISLWPVEPSFSNQSGRITLEGVVLNGYGGSSGNVVTLNFRAISEGSAYVRFTSGSVLANDGQGTNVLTSSNGSSFQVAKRTSSVDKKTDEKTVVETLNTIKIEQIKSPEIPSNQARFSIKPPRPIIGDFNIQIDSETVLSFTDDGTGVYTTPPLDSGQHTIKVTAYDKNNVLMSGVFEFTTLQSYKTEDAKDTDTGIKKAGFIESNIYLILINLGFIVIVLIALLFFLIHIISKNKKSLKQKIQESRLMVLKSFTSLEDDEERERMLIQKLKNHNLLEDTEEMELNRFGRNIHEAEKLINNSLNKINEED